MKSTDIVVTYLSYLIFEFSFQHVLLTRIHDYVCIVHIILCMKMHCHFFLNTKHGASRLYLAGPNTNVRPREGLL